MNELIFLDTETTGNDVLVDYLFQVCYKHNEAIISEYFKPQVPISVKSQSITHVTNKMVADKKPFAESKMKETLATLLRDNILVAHNAVFDIDILAKEGVKTSRFICTLKVARFLDKEAVIPEYNLQYLRYYLELDVDASAHEAKDDVLVLEALFKRLYARMLTQYKDHDAVIEEMVKISSQPSLFKVFLFGKHKGKKIDEVLLFDRGYMEWLLESKQQKTTLVGGGDEDWIFTLKHYLGIK
jgi:DNA polymerase III epsilon subunit-like protein